MNTSKISYLVASLALVLSVCTTAKASELKSSSIAPQSDIAESFTQKDTSSADSKGWKWVWENGKWVLRRIL